MRFTLMFIALCLLCVSTSIGDQGGQIHCWGNGVNPGDGYAYPTELAFNDVEIGATVTLPFVIKNIAPTGSQNLVGSIWRNPDCSADITIIDDILEYNLAPGDSVIFMVQFTPTYLGTHVCDIGWGRPE